MLGLIVEIDGELAHGRELVARRECPGGDGSTDLVDDLAVNGHAAVKVERKWKAGLEELFIADINVLYN